MKIIVCGPPHSGKSVFISNLEKYLPSDSFITIRANRDGEGIWSNNKNQNIVHAVREKNDYDNNFITEICKVIDNSIQSIVLVDIGGKLLEDKIPIFNSCDAFIVLSNNSEYKEKWKLFGNKLNLECLATLDSSLEGTEQIYSKKPYLQGQITNLKRGTVLKSSSILEELANTIIEKSNYKNIDKNINNIIDFNDIASTIGSTSVRILKDGTKIENTFFKPQDAQKIFDLMQQKYVKDTSYKINGARANWVSGIAVSYLKNINAKDIAIFDTGFAKYIPIKSFNQQPIDYSTGLSYHIVESENSIFLDVDITKPRYSLEDYEKCEVPQLNSEKTLYISGKLPLWLFNSISCSYSSKEKFVFQPGNGFICYESNNRQNLGLIVKEPKGIDIEKYFQEKKKNDFKKSLSFNTKPINSQSTISNDNAINTNKEQELH